MTSDWVEIGGTVGWLWTLVHLLSTAGVGLSSRLSTLGSQLARLIRADPENGWGYDELTHSIRFQGAARKQDFTAKIDITYEEHR